MHDSGMLTLMGAGPALGAFLEVAVDSAREALKVFMALVLVKLAVRDARVAAITTTVVWASVWNHRDAFTASFPWLSTEWLCSAALAATVVIGATRHGLLAPIGSKSH